MSYEKPIVLLPSPRVFHLASILHFITHRVPVAHFGGINRGHAEPTPRPKRRKWKGWQQQLRENGRR